MGESEAEDLETLDSKARNRKLEIRNLKLQQVTSGDGWMTDVVRPMHNLHQAHDMLINVFFLSYYVITGIVMLNVVVAVLLDEFINTVSNIKLESTQADVIASKREGVLDPLLEKLVHFNTARDLCSKINAMYALLDSDDNRSLSYEEFAFGVRKMTHMHETPIDITPGDWQTLTSKHVDPGGGLVRDGSDLDMSTPKTPRTTQQPDTWLDSDGCLTRDSFESVIREQLFVYVQRQVAFGGLWEDQKQGGFSSLQAVLQGLKLILTNATQTRSSAQASDFIPATSSISPRRPASVSPRRLASGDAGGSSEDRIARVEKKVDRVGRKVDEIASKLDQLVQVHMASVGELPQARSSWGPWGGRGGGAVAGAGGGFLKSLVRESSPQPETGHIHRQKSNIMHARTDTRV
jgi:hypothetical protein